MEQDKLVFPAAWWHAEGEVAVCDLCPHGCRLKAGALGRCGVRLNQGGRLVSLVHGRPAAVHVDPIEKKPLYHFLPGTYSFSIGTVGCNLGCLFCQNWELSTAKAALPTRPPPADFTPARIAAMARIEGCQSVSLTYNEPTVWAEYGLEIAKAAHAAGLKTVSVTNGYIQPAAAAEFYRHIDAANVDLKAFDDDFYRRLCGGRLEPVLAALKLLRRLGVHLEVTNLLIPGENDGAPGIRELCRWVVSELGAATPLHFSAFYPAHKLLDKPVTPRRTLDLAAGIAAAEGLRHVHLGNLHLAT
ncbi:MAG: AmmeMemoRadiSam system radical SAM enzyme [Lentisphaeria bacterium]|jgi:pyruvate formate lyase activating enzyme